MTGTETGGFLHQLAAAAAGHHQGVARTVPAQQQADQLVEGIVAPDIFPAVQDPALGIQRQRRMQGAVLLSLELPLGNLRTQPRQQGPIQRRRQRQHRQCGQRLLNRRHAADAATGRPGQPALVLGQSGQGAIGDGDVQHHPLLRQPNLDVVDLVVVPDDPLAKQKADGKVVEIVRGRHHHRMVDAIDVDGDGHLFHQMIQCGRGRQIDGYLDGRVGRHAGWPKNANCIQV